MLTNFKRDANEEFYKYINDLVPSLMKKYSVPGLAIAFIDHKEVFFKKVYGFSDKANKKQIDYNTIFQVASISKTFTAWGIMKLVQEGKISLDDPVGKHLLSWKLPQSKYNEAVTIRRILNHTAGLSTHGYKGYQPNKRNISLKDSLDGTFNKKSSVRIIAEPGKSVKYSGGGYTVLQLLMEDLLKMDFSEYMKKEILMPIGMKDSSFEYKECVNKDLSKGYGYFGNALPNYIYTEKAAAGLYTTIDDMVEFMLETLNTNDNGSNGVLNNESISSMWTRVNREVPYGLGYHLIKMPKERIVLNYGVNRGWRSRFIILPNTNNAMVVLTNSNTGNNLIKEIALKWLQWKIGDVSEFYKRELNLTPLNKFTDLLNTCIEYLS
ncbi:serine hydrolase domain-containing protein [Alkaliphilus transvaalensis]|uniref:serine hydrolase domain-containing protein n=1 Tax=Alkaliphilus transvaalensis TaxID=114628 RepID=UPI000688D931|nr:serine hydrolase domain-containing protein [Alkaliphilus transvaalensis]